MLLLVVVVVVLVRAGGYPKMKKKLEGGLGGRAQRLTPNALVARNALQMFAAPPPQCTRCKKCIADVVVVVVVAVVVVVVVDVVVVVVVLGCCVPGFNCC